MIVIPFQLLCDCGESRPFLYGQSGDHLLVFQGDCKIKDFPGNYTDYREWNMLKEAEETELKNKTASSRKSATPTEKPL